jgi:hypothetical protein
VTGRGRSGLAAAGGHPPATTGRRRPGPRRSGRHGAQACGGGRRRRTDRSEPASARLGGVVAGQDGRRPVHGTGRRARGSNREPVAGATSASVGEPPILPPGAVIRCPTRRAGRRTWQTPARTPVDNPLTVVARRPLRSLSTG